MSRDMFPAVFLGEGGSDGEHSSGTGSTVAAALREPELTPEALQHQLV